MNGNMAVQQHIPIPKGFEYVTGEKIDGFVIRNTADGSEFTWFPVDILEPNGTLDGVNFCEKFGRRNFSKEGFLQDDFGEYIEPELLASIKKYSGCYVTRYVASKDEESGKPVFKKNKMPWWGLNYYEARNEARAYTRGRNDIWSCEVCGAAWDSIMQWIIQTAKTKEEVTKDSTLWGNYLNTPDSPRQIVKTGSRREWEVNHIADLAGNVLEWTSEEFRGSERVMRGGFYANDGSKFPATSHYPEYPFFRFYTGFRLLLYVM